MNDLIYNQGDKDLDPYFAPLAVEAGGNIESADQSKLKRALRNGFLTVSGVRVFSALIGSDWKMRDAAVKAFLEYIRNPLLPRYEGNTRPLFLTAIEVATYAIRDKVPQIYIDGVDLLLNCLSPPICGNDIDPRVIQDAVKPFVKPIIDKISQTNLRQRDISMRNIIQIFKHPALNVGELVKKCMDISENTNGVSADKQPQTVLLARLEILLHVLEEFGIDESLWDWYPVFTELLLPSLFHPNPNCRLVAVETIVLLYKYVGNDIRVIVNDVNNLKPNLKDNLNSRFSEIDTTIKNDVDVQNQYDLLQNKKNDLETINELEEDYS